MSILVSEVKKKKFKKDLCKSLLQGTTLLTWNSKVWTKLKFI